MLAQLVRVLYVRRILKISITCSFFPIFERIMGRVGTIELYWKLAGGWSYMADDVGIYPLRYFRCL
jgi:hypothetical protein